ncbi:RNA-directed DNA polymerase (Reverse transcriptase), partial [Trifolium medium]|nr:RNA-directed DNA polymerase (Reverse transcriptase) [Trifolium medium]
MTWESLKVALLERYGGHGDGDVYEQLTELKQTGTMEEYIMEFEYLIAQIPKLPEKQFRGYFIHGLKSEIKGKVRSLIAMGEVSRLKLLQIARAVEMEVKGGGLGLNRGFRNGPGRSSHSSGRNGPDWSMIKNKEGSNGGGAKSNSNGPRNDRQPHGGDRRRSGPRDRGFTHLSYNELMDRKQKGLCFKCGGPFHPMHQCPDKQLRLLVIEDEEEEEGEARVLAVEVEEEKEDEKGEMSVLDLHHIAHENHQTMKFQGTIYGVEVLILIDSGATHNFISQRLVHHMDWSVENTPQMQVKLGNGVQIAAQGRCKKLEMYIGDFKINQDVHLFELGGIDVVLGIEWLKTLGDTIINWKQQTMSFWSLGKWITLKNKEGCKKNSVALQSILGKPKPKREGMMWEIEGVEPRVAHELIESENPHLALEGVSGEYADLFRVTCEDDLSENLHRELEEVLDEYANVFQTPSSLPPRRKKEHVINLVKGQGAVSVRPYRYPHHHKNEIEKQIKEMLDSGIIRHSSSSFSSPVILVKKKDNTWRMCIDYRALNKVTIPDKFPIPIIEELLDELHGARFFTKLDLKSGYHQVRVKESDIEKTAFRTHEGHYEFLVMPFGLMNAPSTFQSLMNDVFRSLLRKHVLVFFDDILIYSKDWDSHIKHLKEVLSLLNDHKLVANRKKCSFAQKSVEYLGHLITGEGVACDPNKVISVVQWPQPRNVKGVRGFLGLTGYYRKFIKDYGKIAKPLTELTKKDSFKWNEQAQLAFEKLKDRLTTAPVLALPDFSKSFLIECDASGTGLGAILMQDKKPIAYFSKALGMRNLAKSTYEKELMAVVLAIQHWRPYLLGRKFVVSTDHKSLKQLMQQKIVTAEQQNWAAKLMGYDFDIVYKQGKLNKGADALSRVYEGVELTTLHSAAQWAQVEQIKEEINKDEKLQKIIVELQQDPMSWPGYAYKQGVLWYENRM